MILYDDLMMARREVAQVDRVVVPVDLAGMVLALLVRVVAWL